MHMETPWNGIVIGNAARPNDMENGALKNHMEIEARRNVMENAALRNYVEIAAGRNIIGALYASIRRDPRILNGYDEVPFENTPLHIAASRGNIEFAMEMMNLKPSFAKKLNRDGSSPLHLALENNRLQMVRLLVNADKDLVRVKGREGMTPFHKAVAANNLDALAEFLVACPECIVDVNIRGQTALHIAGMVEALQIMVHWLRRNSHKDGDVWQDVVLNTKDNEGNTVLHVAATNNHPQMISLLLNSSVAKNLKNLDKLTPLDILQQQANAQDARSILQSAGGLNVADIPDIPTLPDFLQSNITCYELMCKSVVRQQMNITNKTRSALLVVAGLMLTAAYNASLNPPGGISPGPQNSSGDFRNSTTDSATSYLLKGFTIEDNPVGKSVMTSRGFLLFYALSTLTFFLTSMVTIQLLISDAPIFIMLLFSLSLALFTGCYICAITVITPTTGYGIVLGVSLLLIVAIVLCLPWTSSYASYLDKKYKYKLDQDGMLWRPYEDS